MYYIITTRHKIWKNWSGKEFSDNPAKIYCSILEVEAAISGYMLAPFAQNDALKTTPPIIIKKLSEKQKDKLLKQNKIRW